MKRALRAVVLAMWSVVGLPFLLLYLPIGLVELLFVDRRMKLRQTTSVQVMFFYFPWHKVWRCR